MKDIKWTKIKKQSLPNLHVLTVNGKELGFVYKPRDSRTDKNAWRVHNGIGDATKFRGHEWTKKLAMMALEKNCAVYKQN